MTAAGADGPDPWATLAAGIRGCTRCPLAVTRQHAVPGDPPGPDWSGLLLVGEGPGADEDRSGLPFVGRSGRLLDEVLAEAGLARPRVAVANVVKCRPPGNRAPRAGEVAACRPWLSAQLADARPRLIVALGTSAVRWFLGPQARLTVDRGRVHAVPASRLEGRVDEHRVDRGSGATGCADEGCVDNAGLGWRGAVDGGARSGAVWRVLPTYHPSAALRFGPAGEPRRALAEDLALAARLLGTST